MIATSNRSQTSGFLVALAFLPLTTATIAAPLVVTIEPDDYAHRQKLNAVSPYVSLRTSAPPDDVGVFDVVAYTDTAGASTGTKVFAEAISHMVEQIRRAVVFA